MYRRSKFLELLLEIRQDMAEEAAHEVDEFVENLRGMSGAPTAKPVSGKAEPENVRLNGSEIRKAQIVARKG